MSISFHPRFLMNLWPVHLRCPNPKPLVHTSEARVNCYLATHHRTPSRRLSSRTFRPSKFSLVDSHGLGMRLGMFHRLSWTTRFSNRGTAIALAACRNAMRSPESGAGNGAPEIHFANRHCSYEVTLFIDRRRHDLSGPFEAGPIPSI